MTVRELYQQYQLMRNLQEHMVRVAGVAAQICDTLTVPVDRDNIVLACLLHDMGNIIKFSLERFPEFLSPEGLEYWQKVQQDTVQKYGTDEHRATLMMLDEVGVSARVRELVDAVMFHFVEANLQTSDMGKKICAYADMRVDPYGVVSLADRLEDGRQRYGHNPGYDEIYQISAPAFYELEAQIFLKSTGVPEDITNQSVVLDAMLDKTLPLNVDRHE